MLEVEKLEFENLLYFFIADGLARYRTKQCYTFRYRQSFVTPKSYSCGVCVINYLCTYDLYDPVRNAFDAGIIHYEGKWEGPGWALESRVFWVL